MRLVFMYGGGNNGGEVGWPPEMAGEGRIFLKRLADSVGDDPKRDSDRLVELAQDAPVHLVGVSYGGIAAVLAAQRVPSEVRSLTLFEPTLPHLAPEAASVRALRRSLEPLLSQRNDPRVTDSAFFNTFAAATETPTPSDPDDAQTFAKRLRATPLPWEVAMPCGQLSVPTLVVTEAGATSLKT
jgi:pimeloyl-ACP methyl ester carboxylesterase